MVNFNKIILKGLLVGLMTMVLGQKMLAYDFLMTAPFTHSSSTVGAGNDCFYRSGQDRMYAIFIPYPGTWRFSLCGTSPAWDAYIYLATQECNLTTLATNDNGCGALLPTMDVVFSRGGYYFLDVEPNVAGAAGADYTLDVSYITASCAPGIVRTTGASSCQGIPTFTTNGNYYLRSNTTPEPFGFNTNITAMNDVFGSGKWTSGFFETVNVSQVFSSATKFVYMEGSGLHAIEFRSFLTSNLTAIQNWVSAGGNLYMNVAPSEGSGFSLGFAGVTLTYPVAVASGVAVTPLPHPIFAGPVSPCTTSFTGANFANATVAGGSIISLMNAAGGASILAWKASGTGRVYFSTLTMPDGQSPATEAQSLKRNILAQASGHYAPGGNAFTYLWSDGSTTQTITPGPSATYTVTVTNASGCSGTASTVVFASPVPTLTGSPGAPYCGINSTTLTATPVGAGGNPGYATTTIANNFVACGANAGPSGDDVVGGPYNIGFNFVFFGQIYNQFGISTNGNIQLGSSGYNSTPNNVAFPTNTLSLPTIAIAWDDLDAGAADIRYQTTGTAPNRTLVVCFNNLTHFGGNVSGQIISGRIILYETTGVFEIHTLTSNDFVSATQGYQLNGTTGVTLRDGAWGAADARRMTPITQFSYTWTGGTTDQTLVVNTSGTYNVSVTEAATGCSASATQTVVFSPGVTASLSGGPNYSCLGGLLTATPSAGVAPFTYLWSSGETTQSASITTSGTYFVTVTDAGMCTATLTETVTVQPGVVCSISGGTDFCDQGILTVSAFDGNAPYTYLWSDGSTTSSITVINTGTYTVTVLDAIGCECVSSQSVTVNSVPAFSITNSPGLPLCPPVTVTLTTGLDLPFTFLWSGGETTSSITTTTQGTYTVTVTSGGVCTASATTTLVFDNQAPTISCPANITLNADAGFCSSANVTFEATATDNCGTVTLSYNPASGSTFNVGTTAVTATATDAVGNVATCTFNVTIVDNQAPTITCPVNFSLNVDTGMCSRANVTYTATATDNCGIASIAYSPASGSTLPVGINTVNVTATDLNGLVSTCSFRVTIVDNESPVIACPSDIVVTANAGQCIASNVTYTATATDNCGVSSIAFTPVSGTTFGVGITSVTVTATDINGRTSTCTFIVTVLDHAAPEVTCPGDITLDNTPGICGTVVTYNVTVTDDCAQFPALPPVIPGFAYIGAMDGSAFYRSTTTLDYDAAINSAQQNGGHLATIGSAAQNSMITAGLGGNRAYIGLHERSFENNYVWMTGEPLIYTRWEGGEPNNQSGNETCVELRTTGLWADVPATSSKHFVMEIPFATLQTGLASGSVFPVGVTTVTWMASDDSGHTSTCSFNVTVNDIEPPTIACPANITTNNAPGTCGATVTYAATATDICGNGAQLNAPIASNNAENGNMFDITATKEVTINSFSGNLTNGTVNYQIYYRAGTHVGHENVAGDWTLIGTTSVTSNGVNTYTPIPLPVNVTIPAGQTYGFYLTTTSGSVNNRFHTGTGVGNPAVSDANIIVREGIAKDYPFAAALSPRVWEGIVNYTYYDRPVTFSTPSGSTFAVGVNTVTASASDVSGNISTCTFTVTVNDVEVPVITCPSNIFVNADAGVCDAVVTFAATASDNCGTANLTYSPASGSTFPIGNTVVTVTADDGNGNTATCSFTVTVTDNEAPVFGPTVQFAAPALALANVGEASEYSLAYTLNFPNIANWDLPNQVPYTTNNAAALATTPFDRVAYMMELNGQWVWVSMNAFTANVSQTGIPTGATNFQQTVSNMNVFASGGAPVTTGLGINTGNIELWANCYATGTGIGGIGGNGGIYDFNDQFIPISPNCYGSFQVHNWAAQQTILAANGWSFGNALDLGIGNQVGGSGNPDWTYAGNAANFGTKRLYVLVRPSSGCVSNITTNAAAGQCTAVVTYAASATDNCGTPTITYSPASGSTFNIGTTTVTATANDGNGNTSACTFTVTVNDNQAPTITCPSNISVNSGAGLCNAVVTFAATASDNCGTATLSYNPASGSTFPLGNTTVTATANDGNGNTSTCTFTVTVLDNQSPTITCPSNISVNAGAGVCNAVVTYAATASDNCGTATLSYNPVSGSTFPIGNTTVTATANDGNGNISTCSFIVTVVDNQAPTFPTFPANLTMACGADTSTLSTGFPTAFDFCGTATVTYSDVVTGNTCSEVISRTFRATDQSGNIFTRVQTITRVDFDAPTYTTFPANISVSSDPGICGAVVTWTAPTVADNCSAILSLTYSQNPGTVFPVGTTTVVVTVRDVCGNARNRNLVIVVTDNQAPSIACPSNISVNAGAGACNAMVTFAATASDNCGTANLSYSPASGSTFPIGNTSVTVTSNDGNGNISTCSFIVTVDDNQVPIIACPSNLSVNADAGLCTATVTFAATASDNCGTATLSYSPSSGSTFPIGNTVVTATASDANGNVSSCTFTVTVTDSQAPSIVCPGNQTQIGAGQINLANYTGMATASDLCGAVTVTQSPAPNTPYIGNQTVVVVLTATDPSGNTATCAFNVVITTATCGPANRIFVDDNAVGANNGTSWDDAYTSLQSALTAAVSGTEIWVKQGTYKPTATTDRLVSFDMKPDVAIYGGFPQNATCATLLVERDPAAYPSILSGDIGVAGVVTDNSVCLVRAFNVGTNAIMDGFTVRDAYCVSNQKPAPVAINSDGAGTVSSPTFGQMIFTNNYNANNGGAMIVRAVNGGTSSPNVSNSVFSYNVAAFDGGAVFSTSKFSATVNAAFTGCNFIGNTANADGGAIYQWMSAYCNSTLTFNDCDFSGNIALSDGGAIWNYGLKSNSFLIMNNTTFNNNTAVRGAGIFQTMTTSSANVALTACEFNANIASGDGGGMYIYGDKTNADFVNVQRSLFKNNDAVRGGGAFLYNLGGGTFGTGYFENCVFFNNGATTHGGGLGVYARSLSAYNTTLLSCSFHANHANQFGGAVSNFISNVGSISNLSAQNCIVWDNPANAGKAFYGQNVGASTSFTDGILDFASCASNETGTGAFTCSGLLAANPMFVNGPVGDLHLTNGSPAIDAGGPGSLLDYDGASRPVGNGFDMGAFEYGGIVAPRLASQEPVSNIPSSISIYPNPTSGKFTIEFDKAESGRVEVLDMQGRILLTQELESAKWVELSMWGRASGTYLVRTVTESGIEVQKLVVRLP